MTSHSVQFIRHESRSAYDPVKAITYLFEWDTFHVTLTHTIHHWNISNQLVFHRRTSDSALFYGTPTLMPGSSADPWSFVYFFPSFHKLLLFKATLDTPLDYTDSYAIRAYHERPIFTPDIISLLTPIGEQLLA